MKNQTITALMFHFQMASFCKVVGKSKKDDNLLVVDILDGEGNYSGEMYTAHKNNLNTISSNSNVSTYTKKLDTKKIPKDFQVISQHFLYSDITLVLCKDTNTVTPCDTASVMATELLQILI
jgi:hypothetical protein